MLLSPATSRWLIGSAAAVTFIALAQRPSAGLHGAAVAADTASGVPALESGLTPLAAGEPDGRTPIETGKACDETIAAAKRAVDRADGELTDDDVLHLCRTAADAAAESATCAARVRDVLAAATTCGRAYGAIASCAAPSPQYSPAWTRELLGHATPACQMRLVSSLHQARVVDAALLANVSDLLDRERTPERHARIWLALGTLVRTARTGSPDARARAAQLDAKIAAALSHASGRERVVMLETAGNAACVGCIADVRRELDSQDPALRRSAIAALRFLDDESSVASLCHALETDPTTIVREHAAWSLRWSASNETARTACLDRAAQEDEAENVRHAAELSLFALSGRAPSAATALARLTGAGSADELAWLASNVGEGVGAFDGLGNFNPFGDSKVGALQ